MMGMITVAMGYRKKVIYRIKRGPRKGRVYERILAIDSSSKLEVPNSHSLCF